MHRRLSRAMSLVVALLMTMTFFASGSAPIAAQDSGSLTLWHGWTGAEADTLNDQIIPAWEAANPGVSISVLAVPFDQLKNKYQTEVATGGGPDLLIGPADWVGELAGAELIRPLDDLVSAETLGQYVPSAVDALRYTDGSLYGLPESIETVALYYNTDLVPTAPTTTAELTQMSAEIAATIAGHLWPRPAVELLPSGGISLRLGWRALHAGQSLGARFARDGLVPELDEGPDQPARHLLPE